MRKLTSLFNRGKTNACVQRCEDTTLVQFSSPVEVTTEDFDAQTVALNLLITVMRPITPNFDDEFTVILVRTSNNWFRFLFSLVGGGGQVRHNRVWNRGLMSAGSPTSQPVS